MTDMTAAPTFAQRLNGRFTGILRWDQLDELWSRLKQSDQAWYFYQVGLQPPTQPMSAEELADSIDALDASIRRGHAYDYCGIVYVDDKNHPSLVKVYDPHNLGSSCGCGSGRIPPRWVISVQKPEQLVEDSPAPATHKRWWNQLWHAG